MEDKLKGIYIQGNNSTIISNRLSLDVPATRASFGHLLNQSMVQPDISAGNLSARLRNFSPTGEKHRTTWRLFRTRDMKYSYKFSLVGGRLGNSRFITGMRSLRISSISSRANRLDT